MFDVFYCTSCLNSFGLVEYADDKCIEGAFWVICLAYFSVTIFDAIWWRTVLKLEGLFE